MKSWEVEISRDSIKIGENLSTTPLSPSLRSSLREVVEMWRLTDLP